MGENQGWQVGELWEVDESRQYLRCVDIWHTDDFANTRYVEQRRALRIAPDVELAGRVWQRHLPLWIPDLAEEPMLPLAILGEGHRACTARSRSRCATGPRSSASCRSTAARCARRTTTTCRC